MRKNYISKFIVLTIALVSLNSLATTYSTEERICPIGGQKFTREAIMSYSTNGKRLDLKPLGNPIAAPLPLIVCPNGFVDFQKSYSEEEIISLTKLVNSPSYQSLRSSNTDYFMFAQILEHIEADNDLLGWIYLQASWEAENYGHPRYDQYLNLAIHNLNIALDESDGENDFFYRFLIVELNRLKGDFISAKNKLQELEANIVPVDYEIVLVDFMKELIDSLNAEPQRLPKP